MDNALTPDALGTLKQNEPKTVAAGMPAVVASMKHVFSQAGLVRGTKALLMLNQVGGVDCSSCAWPDPDHDRSTAEFCENGAKAIAWEADTRRLTAEIFAQQSIDDLAKLSDYGHGQHGRLVEPMVLWNGSRHYEPIAWDDAFQLMATELNALASPNEAAFYTSGRTSNEAAFLYQLFVRLFGTNNLPDCSNMCHESSGKALSPTIGIGKGTVTLDDFEKAQLILILGQNPGTNHPRMLTSLQKAKRAGAIIVAINPLKEAGLLAFHNPQEVRGLLGLFRTQLADHYLQVKIGGDQALLNGLLKTLIATDAIDANFIAAKTDGFDELKAIVAAIIVGAHRRTERHFAKRNRECREAHCEHGSHYRLLGDGADAAQARGRHHSGNRESPAAPRRIGKPGAGLCPVRGHSNVQGDRTMGIWEHPPTLERCARKRVRLQRPERGGLRHRGRDSSDARAAREGLLRPRRQLPLGDARYRIHRERASQLPSHGACFDQAEPLASRAGPHGADSAVPRTKRKGRRAVRHHGELDGRGADVARPLAPASPHLLSEVAIVARLAKATLKSNVPWDEFVADYDHIRDRIARVVPGFEDYNLKVRSPGGFYLPNMPREGEYPTASGSARFTATPLPEIPVPPGQLVMMTIRSHDQFNTTVYGLHDRYRGLHGERRVVLMNETDMRDRALKNGDVVRLESEFNGVKRLAENFIAVKYDIPRGNCATYFPETNVLVPIDSIADGSHTPTSKWVLITVEKSNKPSA